MLPSFNVFSISLAGRAPTPKRRLRWRHPRDRRAAQSSRGRNGRPSWEAPSQRQAPLYCRRAASSPIFSLTHQVSYRAQRAWRCPTQRHLIISAALRNEALARALAQQSPQGMTVFLGRTWAPPDAFSLTVTTPQYRRPAHPRVLENPLTLHGLNEASLNAAREASEAALLRGEEQALGVLIGGPSGTYTLGPKGARRLLAEAQALAGSRPLWVTTSPRTPSAAVARLASHPWRHLDRFLPWGSAPISLRHLTVSPAGYGRQQRLGGLRHRKWFVFDLGAGSPGSTLRIALRRLAQGAFHPTPAPGRDLRRVFEARDRRNSRQPHAHSEARARRPRSQLKSPQSHRPTIRLEGAHGLALGHVSHR